MTKEYVAIEVFRGFNITGKVYCGRSLQDQTKLVVVAIAGHPRQSNAVSASEIIGEWRDGTLAEFMEAEALLFAHKHGLRPVAAPRLEQD